jgi:uncharacterized membrane protein YfcA
MTLLALVLLLLVGVLIGAVGIGGFLVVPVLVFLEGRSVRDAVIAATVSFVGSGLVALLVALRHGTQASNGGRAFLLANAPGALVGALLLRIVNGTAIGFLIAFAVGLAGLAELRGWPKRGRRKAQPLLATVNGFMTGAGSALTGTSGPLIAMPLLAWAGMPIVERIRAGQVAQLPIAAAAALVFVAAGDIAWTVAAMSALVLAAGTLLGMRITTALAPDALRRAAAILMLLSAASMLGASLALPV